MGLHENLRQNCIDWTYKVRKAYGDVYIDVYRRIIRKICVSEYLYFNQNHITSPPPVSSNLKTQLGSKQDSDGNDASTRVKLQGLNTQYHSLLLHGPSGVGKSFMAKCIVEQSHWKYYFVNASAFVQPGDFMES